MGYMCESENDLVTHLGKEIGRKPRGRTLVACHALSLVLRQSRGGIGGGAVGLEIRAK